MCVCLWKAGGFFTDSRWWQYTDMMENLFKSHKKLTEKDYPVLWEKGLFIFDTNVLLDLYRLPENARNNLFEILTDKKIKDRIWLPFQVAMEFTYNKLEVISDQKNKFNNVKTIINNGIAGIETLKSEILSQIQDLQLKKRHSVINPDKSINSQLFDEAFKKLNTYLEELNTLEAKQPDVTDEDPLKDKIESIFEDKIGTGFSKEELEAIYKEGELRYKEEIPPGYKDRTKTGIHMYQDKKYIRKFGDLIVWKEIIDKAKKDKLEYIIFVISDSKDDWWQKERGRKIGPRYELLNEIYFAATELKIFCMYDTSQFMKYSQQHLNIKVDENSIQETKDIIEFNRFDEDLAIEIKDSISQYKSGLLAETELERIVQSLFSNKYSLRTLLGINKETGIGKERVKEVLDHLVEHGFAKRKVGFDGKDYWELQQIPIRIYSAAYKWLDGYVDVTAKIKELVSKNIYQGPVDPSTFGIPDPIHGTVKTLVIHCRIHGMERELSFRDGQTFKIE